MLQEARNIIKRYAAGKRVAAAVSGGEDSMALLSLLLACRDEGLLSLCVVHVDHGIRARSFADADFVRDYCAARNVPFTCKRVDIPALCRQSGRGIECEAHFARKEIFAELVASGKADMVATAHHARDNAETVLLHLFRGAGLKGLSGMRVFGQGILRPFLTTPKEEICAYVQKNDIPFVVDETNADSAYDRNYLRNELFPRIAARFPSFERAIGRTANYAAEADALVAMQLCPEAFAEREGAVLLREEYLTPPYIFEALARAGKTADVYATAIDGIMGLKDCKPCARIDLGDGYAAAREYGAVAFYCKQENAPQAEIPFCADVSVIPWGDGAIAVEQLASVNSFRKGDTVLDADKLPSGCVWRTRRDGDVFTPFGGGTKKLKEYLIDNKIPRRLRDGLPLLCQGNEVLAIAGIEISEKVRVTQSSAHVVRIVWHKGAQA